MSDNQIRGAIRKGLELWLRKLNCDGDAEKKLYYKQKFVDQLKNLPIAVHTKSANEQHYEVPTSFLMTVLGKRAKYSACLYPEGVNDLDSAEEASLSLYCERAIIRDGQTIMDLGCGWGSLTFWLLENYPNCRVTSVSNSATQGEYIRSSAQRKGYSDRLTVYTADANTFQTEQRFDRIMAIEMLEHMKNYEQLFKKIASWLKPDGLLFTQILCHREFTYHFKTKPGSDTAWMAQNFFTGGTMPSSDLFLYFQKDLAVEKHWNINGLNYTKTLDAWLKKMDDNIDEVRKIFHEAYGEKEVQKHVFNWRKFFMFSSEVFGCNDGNDWLVAHHLFCKQSRSMM